MTIICAILDAKYDGFTPVGLYVACFMLDLTIINGVFF